MLPIVFTFLACTTTPVTNTAPLVWQGWVYEDIPTNETLGLEEGSMTMLPLDGGDPIEGQQQDTNRLANWSFEFEADREVQIRVEGPEHIPTIWRTRTPHDNAFWYSGSLFAVRNTTFTLFLDGLAELMEETSDNENDQTVMLYGEPLSLSEGDEEAWTDAHIWVYDSAGGIHEATVLFLDEETGGLLLDGPEPGPIAAFVVTGIAPGPVSLVVDASDGRSTAVEYQPEPGDLVSAFAFTLPWEQR